MKLSPTLLLFLGIVYAAKIVNLPDYKGPPLEMYSGYITIDPVSQKRLFYWLIEAETNAATKPLTVWYQGGPGCSSLAGLLTEHGPLRPDSKGIGLVYTDLSWIKYSNMLYVEAPAGVGFSYSNNINDYNTTDTQTAKDNHKFLEGFMQEFPKYLGRDLWITGESYGGVYVPTLAELILRNRSDPLFPQLKGLMIGNGVIDCDSVDYTTVQFDLLYYHALVSHSLFASWRKYGCYLHSGATVCQNIFNLAVQQIGVIDQELGILGQMQPSLDPDDLYQDFCTGNGTLEFTKSIPIDCDTTGQKVTRYLNRPDVQNAIHAKATKWSICSNSLNYNSDVNSLIPYYKRMFAQKPSLAVLIYSGDVDIMTVPFAMTSACLSELDSVSKKISTWQPWFVNGATAGYVEVFDTYTHATLKGAGHEAPSYQPLNSLNMFGRFLTKRNITSEGSPAIYEAKPLSQSGILRKLRGF